MPLPLGIEWKDLILPAVLAALAFVGRMVVKAVRPTRQMAWIDRAAVRLADLTRPEAGDLMLVFKGREIKQAAVRTIRVQNVGKEAVRATDIEKPVRIELGEGAALLNASIAGTSGIASPNPTVEGNAAILPNLNWNGGDWADVQLVYEGKPSHEVKVGARIVDFPPLRRILPDEKRAAWVMIGLVAYVFVVFSPILLMPFFGISDEDTKGYLPVMMAAVMLPLFGYMVYDSDPIRILRGKAPKPPSQRPRL